MKTAATVLHEGKIIDLHGDILPSPAVKTDPNRYTRFVNATSKDLHYVRLIPLQMGKILSVWCAY